MAKLYPSNHHQNYYADWHYLGNDGQYDYYVLPWEQIGNGKRSTAGGVPLLSIVGSEEPSDYWSPCYQLLLQREAYRKSLPQYMELAKRLVANGYHLTGRTLPKQD